MGPIITLIQQAYDLIKDPERWTQGYYQRDEDGNSCEWRNGYSFCAIGALHYTNYIRYPLQNIPLPETREDYHYALCLLQRISEELFQGQHLQNVNDNNIASVAHKNILKVYETALERFADKEPTQDDCYKDLNKHIISNKN